MPAQEFTEDEVVEAWSSVADLDTLGANRLQKATVKAQPVLIAFTMAFTEGMRDDARALAIFVLHCVLHVFQQNASSVAQVSEKAITAQWPRSVERVGALATALTDGAVPNSYVATGPQRFVLEAIFEALAEDEEADGEVELTGDEYWHLLAVLDAAVATLDAGSTPRLAV